MAKINKNVAPYYDDYDSSKQYTQLLAVPGRVAQAREFTQVQSTMRDIMKSIGDSLLKDGNIIEGCQVIVSTEKKQATVTAGKVYINGMVLPVSTTTIGITGVGTETIGFKLSEIIVTEETDPSLKDPAQSHDNYNQPGCHRVKSTVSIVRNDTDAATLTTLVDGNMSIEKYAPDYDNLTQTLARRTYDESGSYIVNGLNVRIDTNPDTAKFNIIIEPGKAYVLGYELKIPASRRLALPRAITSKTVTLGYITYLDNVAVYQLSKAPYVKDIVSVAGYVSKSVNQTIVSNTDRVLLDELEVSAISEIKQGGTVYTAGTDYELQREGTRAYVQWKGTSTHPVLNTSYSVTYSYNTRFTQGTDYILEHDVNTDAHNLKWLAGHAHPINNTAITVVYNLYLARKDVVYIDKEGTTGIIQGVPNEYGYEITPEAPINTLTLAAIYSPPNGSISTNANLQINVSNVGLTRFTMTDIQRLLSRVRTLEYDQTILSLNDEAKQYETSSAKRGIFTDPLIDMSKIDYYYNLADGKIVNPALPTYDVNLDLDANMIFLPLNVETTDAVYDTKSTVNKSGRTVSLSKIGESVVLSQMNATRSFLINPYSTFPQLPEISLDPAVDTWIDDTIITVPLSQNASEVVSSSTRNTTWSTSASWWYTTTTSTVTDTVIGTKVSTSSEESVIKEESIAYIRPREVNVEGSQFPPSLDNIKCYFEGVSCPLIPSGTTVAGTDVGSIRASLSGDFTAKFNIPSGMLTGIREITLKSDIPVSGYETSAIALYQSSGTARTIQKTVTTLTTVLINRITTIQTNYYLDPVGQTFVLDRMTLISGIDLYFESKATGTVPVTCDIRDVVNGTISSTSYGHCTLSPSQVNVSSDSTLATRFTFDDPVLLEENKEYAFVVRSTSTNYRLWIADLGEKDILTGESVLTNPYLIGVMLSSSNNSSWTIHQTADVKFKLISDKYSDTAELLFTENTPVKQFSRINLLAESIIPNGTTISWYYSIDGGTSYSNIAPANIELLDRMVSKIKYKALLTKQPETTLSPIIALDSITSVLSSYDVAGHYITKNISGLDAYTTVDIILDTFVPSNTRIKVYVSRDNGATLVEATLKPAMNRTLNYGWKEQTYSGIVASATQCKIFIKLESDYKHFTPAFRRLRVIMS